MEKKPKRQHSEKKTHNIRFFIIAALLLLTLALYVYYVVVYRTKHERASTAQETNTDAALYTLPKQMSILRSFEEMYDLAFDGRATETDYGTIAIPGLKETCTLPSNKSEEIEVCTSMTPQGLAVAEDYLLISAYCHTHQHNSVVYVLDKNTHEFIKEIVLPGKIHAGGLAYDTKHHMIWVATSHKGRAAAAAFSMKNLKVYNLETQKKPIAYTFNYELYSLERDSFMSYADGYLYIGHYSQSENSVVQKFRIGVNGGLTTSSGSALGLNKDIALPEDIKKIPKKIQGFAVYEDKVILTQSYGIMTSQLLVHNYNDVMYRTKKKYTLNKITLPQKLEQIYIDGENLYILFESAAYAYSAQPLPKVDRILKLRLSDVIKVDVEDLKSERDVIPEDDEQELKAELITAMPVREMVALLNDEWKIDKNQEAELNKIENMLAGTVIPQERLRNEDIDSLFYTTEIDESVFLRMDGISYKAGAKIPIEDLRYVRVLYYGFDGETHIGELVVNKSIAEETAEIFRELYRVSYPIEKMVLIDNYGADDEASMADNNTSAFNYRNIAQSTELSMHGQGLAIDINPKYNPYVRTVGDKINIAPSNAGDYVDRSQPFAYKIDNQDLCYQIFTEHGFSWGGDWTYIKDYQHFEKDE